MYRIFWEKEAMKKLEIYWLIWLVGTLLNGGMATWLPIHGLNKFALGFLLTMSS